MLPEGFIPEQLSSPDAIELRGFEEMVREVASRVPSEPAGLMDNGQGSESEDNGEALFDEGRGSEHSEREIEEEAEDSENFANSEDERFIDDSYYSH